MRRWFIGGIALAIPGGSAAQTAAHAPPGDIVVVGEKLRGSAIGDSAPVAVLDAQAIKALGASRIDDLLRLLKPLTTSNSGADPVFLLNGRRISGYEELQTLPPEAIERTEILAESDSARFGFPPTVRITNFITKRRFRALEASEDASTTTEGGGSAATFLLGSTRLDKDRRTSVTLSYERQDPLLASRRSPAPDPGVLYDTVGTIAAPAGGSVDPALDALAGRPVTSVSVPGDLAARATLAGYAAAAAGPRRITDLAPYQSLTSRDQLRVNATHAMPIGNTVTGSLNLSMDAQRGMGLAGLSTAALRVPAGNPAVPFAGDVLLYRYLPEAGVLAQRTRALTLHGGATLQGSLRRWLWSVTGSYDRSRTSAMVDLGVDTGAAQAAIDAGADPFQPFDAAWLRQREVSRSRTLARTVSAKANVTGPLLALPAGDARVTLTADAARTSSAGRSTVAATPPLRRDTESANVAFELPLASAERGILSPLGTLTANAGIGIAAVSDYGSLASRNLGLIWAPRKRVQITASTSVSRTAPEIALLTQPVVAVPNAPFFDFLTGTSPLVTVVAGGNPALGPQRRQIDTAGIGWQPFRGKELRFNLDYIETTTDGQVSYPVGGTDALQSAFPDRFERDAAGRLVLVDLRPLNLARERERKLQARVSLWTMLGAKPPEPPPPAKEAPPPPPPKPRPSLYTFVTATARIDDRLLPRVGQPELDLLAGESVTGNGGRTRYEVQGTLGGSVGAVNGGVFGMWQGATRIRSPIAASDLSFSGRTFLALYSTIDAQKIANGAAWAKSLSFQFNVNNLLNTRTVVRDRNGMTPYRYQRAFLDPYGRMVKLTVRKLF